MPWQHIRGHDALVDHFRKLLASGRMPHAMLFVGPPSVGKTSFARAFAQGLLCERAAPEALNPCGTCPGCKQVAAETHPDFIVVRKPEEKSELDVDTIRNLNKQLGMKPVSGKYRIAILVDADLLNANSSNAFLKTLEEPGPGSILILIDSTPDNQLETVVSRCQVVRFAPLSTDDIESILLERGLINQPAEARRLAEQAEGSVARALALADHDYREARRAVIHELVNSNSPLGPNIARLMEDLAKNSSKEPSQQRRRALLLLEDISRFFRDVLWSGAGLAAPSGDEVWAEAARQLAGRCEPEEIFVLADRCMTAMIQLQSNGNLGLCLSAWASDVCKIITDSQTASRR